MDSLPELTRDAAEATQSKARNLIPWLPDPHRCEDCGTYCIATQVFDHRTAAFHNRATPAWECPECQSTFYRERE